MKKTYFILKDTEGYLSRVGYESKEEAEDKAKHLLKLDEWKNCRAIEIYEVKISELGMYLNEVETILRERVEV